LELVSSNNNTYHLSFCNYLPTDVGCGVNTMATVYNETGECAYLSGDNLL